MSSDCSSKRASFVDPALHALSKSVPETPARAFQRPIFRTVPDTPKENPLLLDDHGLDLSILTHKLQLYQLDLEEAELRQKHRRAVHDKEAAEVAAAARFRDELEKRERFNQIAGMEGMIARSRSASLHNGEKTQVPMRSRSATIHNPQETGSHSRSASTENSEESKTRSRAASSVYKSDDDTPQSSLPEVSPVKPLRTKRPNRLVLPNGPVTPQEVQSAALPIPRARSTNVDIEEMKKHWRRTTISAGRHSSSKIILLSSTGKPEYCDFGVPPVPPLSASLSISTAPSISPMTPSSNEPTEDQIRRELETFALEEGPNIQMSRRSSLGSGKRRPAAFVPDPDDRLLKEDVPPTLQVPSAAVEVVDAAIPQSPTSPHSPTSNKKKSFFSRFERKNDVDALLDLYMTDEQLTEAKVEKKKANRAKRQTFFKRWQSTDTLFHRAEKPG